MAVHRPDSLVGIRNAAAQVEDEVPVQLRNRIADRVGDVDRGGPLLDDGLEHAAQEVGVRAVAVLGRKLHICRQVASEPGGQPGLLVDLVRRHAQLFFHVQGTGCQEQVDAGGRASRQSFGRARNVAVVGTGQRAHGAVLDRVSDRPDGFEVTVRRSGETGFDHIDLEALELAGDAQLFVLGHRGTGRLLAVAQGRVENDQLVCHGRSPVDAMFGCAIRALKTKTARCGSPAGC